MKSPYTDWNLAMFQFTADCFYVSAIIIRIMMIRIPVMIVVIGVPVGVLLSLI